MASSHQQLDAADLSSFTTEKKRVIGLIMPLKKLQDFDSLRSDLCLPTFRLRHPEK